MAYIPKTPAEPPVKYTREYITEDGTVSTWYYDRTITASGPYRVEHKYTKEFIDSLKEKKKRVAKTKKRS